LSATECRDIIVSLSGVDTGSGVHLAQCNAEEATLDHMHFGEVFDAKDGKDNGRPHVTFEDQKEPADEKMSEVVTNEVSQNSTVSQTSKCLIPGTVRKLPPRGLRGMIFEAQLHVKQHKQMCAEAQCPGVRPRIVWEVYAGRGRVSEEVEKHGGISEKCGLQQGWDFSRPADRKEFIRRLVNEQPDELMISPECRLWSPLQELTASKSEGARQFLITFASALSSLRFREGMDDMPPSTTPGTRELGRQSHLPSSRALRRTVISVSGWAEVGR